VIEFPARREAGLTLGVELELQLVRAHDRDLAHDSGDLLERLADLTDRLAAQGALERWELSLFESEPSRSQRLREALTALRRELAA